MPRSTLFLPLLLLCVCAFACSEKKHVPAAESPADASKGSSSGVPAVSPSTATSATDPLAGRYTTLREKLDQWRGDRRLLEEARAEAKELLKQNKNYAPAYVALARCEFREGYVHSNLFDSGKLSRAAKLVKHALTLDPKNHEAHLVAASVDTSSGFYDSARAHLDTARELAPEHPGNLLGNLRLANAERNFREVIRLAQDAKTSLKVPGDVVALNELLAGAWEELGMMNEADTAFRNAIAAEPQKAWPHGNYAAFLNRRGRFTEAVEQAEAATRIMQYGIGMQTLYEAYGGRITELFEAKRYAEAGKLVEKLQILGRNDADAHFMIANYYGLVAMREPTGNYLDLAESALRRALEIDPSHEPARKGLESLRARRAK